MKNITRHSPVFGCSHQFIREIEKMKKSKKLFSPISFWRGQIRAITKLGVEEILLNSWITQGLGSCLDNDNA